MKKVIILILFHLFAFSQTDLILPHFSQDPILKFDTILSLTDLDSESKFKNGVFNDSIIKVQLDSLNQLTPLELIYNKTIGQYIKFYLFQRPTQVSKLLALADYYFPIFEEYLDKNNLPMELKYLPVIESALNPNAKSPAGATGIWQFMYYTAKEYNLRINSYLDERKDIYKSTQAACDYLAKSYKVFNNWELAIASYNCGRRNITKAMRRSGNKFTYWDIRPFLPRETRNYIPSFIAALYVMNFADYYNIHPNQELLTTNYQIDSVFLKKPIKISHLAKVLNIEPSVLEQLNPSYSLKLVPSLDSEKFPILLPYYQWGVFLSNEDSIYKQLHKMEVQEKLVYPVFTDIKKTKYKVKRGDYLGRIARKFNCNVSDIMRWNDLKTSRIKEGNTLYIYKNIK